jgi:hypothetical protein
MTGNVTTVGLHKHETKWGLEEAVLLVLHQEKELTERYKSILIHKTCTQSHDVVQ